MKLKNAHLILSVAGTAIPIVLLFFFLAPSVNYSSPTQNIKNENSSLQIQVAKAGNNNELTDYESPTFGSKAYGFSDTFSVLENSVIRNADGFKKGLDNNCKRTNALSYNNCELKVTDRRLPLDAGKKDHLPGSFEHIN